MDNDRIIVNERELGVTPEDVLSRAYNGMAPRVEYGTIPWKKDDEIYGFSEVSVESIRFSIPGPVEVNVGVHQYNLGKYLEVIPEEAISDVQWESSDPEIATVDQNGVVTGMVSGIGKGRPATITASVSSKSASIEVELILT